MPDNVTKNTLEVNHPDWMGIVIKVLGAVVTVLGFAAWYIASMAITTKDKQIEFEATINQKIVAMEAAQASKLDNEIQRSKVEDKDIREDVEENKSNFKDFREKYGELILRMDESIKHLHKGQ